MVYPSPFTRVFSSLLICHLILTSNLPKTLPNRRQNSKLVQVYWHWPSKTAQYASTFVFIRLRLAHLQNTPNPVEALSLWHWESRHKQEFLWNPAHSYTWRTPVIWPLQNSTTLSVTPGHFWHWRPAFLFAYTKFTTCQNFSRTPARTQLREFAWTTTVLSSYFQTALHQPNVLCLKPDGHGHLYEAPGLALNSL